MNFEQIILEDEQKELFIRIVETVKKFPREQRMPIMYHSTSTNGILVIPSESSGVFEFDNIQGSDLDELYYSGLIRRESVDGYTVQHSITPQSLLYYDWLMKEQGKPVERIEKSVIKYIELESFRNNYNEAYKKLKLAEEKLWESDSQELFTAIGHYCREAMQEFAGRLYEDVFEKVSQDPNSSTVKRLREIIEKKGTEKGETVKPFLEALLAYWGTLSDLIQRQEHGAQKEGEPLTWEDARRVVFQTVNVMVELDRTLGT